MRKIVNTNLAKRSLGDWLKVLVLLLDEAAAVVLLVLVLSFFGVEFPLPIIIVLALLAGIFIFIIHTAAVRTFHKKQITGREGMIGLQGRVVDLIQPVGIIISNGEYWKAKSLDTNIEIGEDVEIVGIEGLTLRVIKLRKNTNNT